MCPSAQQTQALLATTPNWGPSSQSPRGSHALGDAHQGWGGCPAPLVGEVAEAESVLNGIRELVHDPFVGSSGAVLRGQSTQVRWAEPPGLRPAPHDLWEGLVLGGAPSCLT